MNGEDEKITAEFDYDNPPFGGLANVELLMKTKKMFPRDLELLPAWHPAR